MARKNTATETAPSTEEGYNSATASKSLTQRALETVLVLAGRQYVAKKRVTARGMSMEDEIPYFLNFAGPFFEAEPLPAANNPKDMDPPIMADVVDLSTGEVLRLMCNTVLISELARAYTPSLPWDDKDFKLKDNLSAITGHIGLSFAITRRPCGKENKNYKVFDIVEIEDAPVETQSAAE